MRRCASFLLLSLLLLNCGQQQLANAKQIELEKLFDAVGTFVPQSKPLLKAAKAIWKTFEQLTDLFDKTPEKPSDRAILEKLKEKMENVDDHISQVGEKIDTAKKDITQEVAKDMKLLAIEKKISKVLAQFKIFLVYRSNNADNDTQINFYKSLIEHGTNSLTTLLYGVNNLVVSGDTSDELSRLITDREQSVALMCKWKRSPMHVLNRLYNQITSAELKAMILIRFAYWYLDNGDFKKHQKTIESYDIQVKSRLDATILEIKHFMQGAGREFWTCESGYNYKKLGHIFFNYVSPEQDIGEMEGGSIKTYQDSKDCSYFKNKIFHHVCKSTLCRTMEHVHKGPVTCKGHIRDCYSHGEGSDMEICLAEPNSGRTYKKLRIGGKVFGKNIECANYKAEYVPWYRSPSGIYNMENCVCTCDDYDNDNANRFFNLKEVTSDIRENKIITGARIILKDKVFEFEIQQAVVTEFGNMNETTVEWKKEPADVPDGRDYYKISYDSRTVNLDVLDSPPNTVLTGIRFSRSKTLALQLEIRYTPIDFASGKLDASKSDWIAPDENGERPEIKFKTELPKGNWFKPDARSRAYLKFTTSSLEDDIGQTVVPFIDTSKVQGIPASMLSGAGLIYKGSERSAGFLSMKLLTYNFEPHLMIESNKKR